VTTGVAGGAARTTPANGMRVEVWDSSLPLPDSVPAALVELLHQAVLETEGESGRLLHDAGTPEEISQVLRQLSDVVRSTLAVGTLPEALPASILGRNLLGILRQRVVEALAQPRPGVELPGAARLLRAVEQVGQAIEPDWSQHFAGRLAGPDGLELVVELAHDLRSPLTSILFLAETLQRGRSGPLTEVQERQLGLIYSAAFGLSAVASDVIELARGGDRLVDLETIPFSITDIFESVRDIVLPIAEEKGLVVEVQAPDSDFRVGHPVALSRVLLNLTTNALKFTNEGKVEVRAAALDGSRVEFAVRDTGRGMPPQALATMYEPFRRRQKAGEYAFSGSGLGLTICRKLVEAMQSTLHVENDPSGKGTRFTFTLDLPRATQG